MYVILFLWGWIEKWFSKPLKMELLTGKWCHSRSESLAPIKCLEVILEDLKRNNFPIAGVSFVSLTPSTRTSGLRGTLVLREGSKVALSHNCRSQRGPPI